MKRLVLVCLVGATLACSPIDPLRTVNNENKQVEVSVITEFDSVRLYRVSSPNTSMRDIYVAVKAGDVLSTVWEYREGKTDKQGVTLGVAK